MIRIPTPFLFLLLTATVLALGVRLVSVVRTRNKPNHPQLYEFAYGNEILTGYLIHYAYCGATLRTSYEVDYYCVTTYKRTENPYAEQKDDSGY